MNLQLIISIIVIVALVEAVLKGIALWKAGNNKQLGWFVALFILNTAGILPILYIMFFQKNKQQKEAKKKSKK